MQNDPEIDAVTAEHLNERLTNAVQAAVERKDKVDSMSSWWKDIREANNFRRSLEELFSGD